MSQHQYYFDPAILDQSPSAHTDAHEILQRSAAFEKALRKSEERLRNLVEYQSAVMNNMAEGLYALDANGLVTSINRAGERILGWTRNELLGKKMYDVTHYRYPDGRPFPASECPGLQVLQKGSVLQELDDCFIRKDGSFVPVVYSASPLRDDGEITGVIVSFRDDTEARRSKDAISTVARQQRALFHLADELHRAESIDGVFNAALNAILDALQCNRASILLCDDAGVMRFVSWRGLSNAYRVATDGHSAWKAGERNPRPVCITDINKADLNESLKATVKKEGIGALAFIPLVSNGRLIGKFMAYFNTAHEFLDTEIDVILTIARQLSFAIDRKRNDETLERSKFQIASEAESLKKLNDCSARLWQVRRLHEGLQDMLSATVELLGADKGNVQLLNAERMVLTIEVQRGFDKEFLDFFQEVSADDDSACGQALRSGERIVIADVEKDAAFAPYLDVARAAGVRAVISCPLVGRDGTPLGVLSTHFRVPHQPPVRICGD